MGARTERLTGLRVRGAMLAGLALFLGAGLSIGTAAAQSSGIVGGGFSNDPKQPIEIEADALEVEDAKQSATFSGNVLVTQGALRMRADRLIVHYASRRAGGSGIERIRATGNVHISAPDDQSASGQWADYHVDTRRIEMGDSVVLRQGENIIRGSKLHVDLNSGRARVSGGGDAASGGTGRVRGLFHPDGS
ncbi:MAG: lipopolysaccharide transport periplasmic protein LptA [Parvibaculum sp.]|uniref:lipopolysaccharide transport periplasmic protein LptA n=1 Tax=Parvibaculum sp. TaxID=2024848 RepID=UPI0026299CF0|nr:lipopolysaccharide transport periplasmic protein LptA [Parvibaculum sp.]MBX3496855.1 lipopolysaccharide transport periplasmic protein LptA [Parvibaculum sp.]MCW5725978.1 lipopolysaccharide transport periplasmic protein LptA [Parvibaculum sp.]